MSLTGTIVKLPDPLLGQPVADRVDRRGARKAHIYNRTTFKINAIV